MEEPEGIDTLGDPSIKPVNWPKPPIINKNNSKLDSDDVVLTFREYNDMLTKIYYLENKNEWLYKVNKHLGEEIESLQKQLFGRKLRKVKSICRLKCAQRMCNDDNKRYN